MFEDMDLRGIHNPRVLRAIQTVPRHEFVPPELKPMAYADRPLPIGCGQTISQPFIVAKMTELAALQPDSRVLEVGTGSGYQAAVLAELVKQVYSVEIVPSLARSAASTLKRLGYDNVVTRIGDAYEGWPEEAPFDAVVVTAAPARVPEPLVAQLAVGGRLVIPVGVHDQQLRVILKTKHGIKVTEGLPVRFVPMVGTAQA